MTPNDLPRIGKDADTLQLDSAQEMAARKLDALAAALKNYRPHGWFARREPPRGIYLWGDVGRGKSMLMDRFFAAVRIAPKRRLHFNAFMTQTHARIHAWRSMDQRARARRREHSREDGDDPIPPVARMIAGEARLLCLDEFQVNDVADAMILGRLFEKLLALGVVIFATSNTAPARLYEGGLNRQVFMPFIAMIENRFDVVQLAGPRDYRQAFPVAGRRYITPLGPAADAAMDEAWRALTGCTDGNSETLRVLGRDVIVPHARGGVARFAFDDLCLMPLAAADYLAIARRYETVLIDRIPDMNPSMRDGARRFIVLVDTFYDQFVNIICSAAAPPDRLYVAGDGADAFRRTASRLVEMQSEDYVDRSIAARAARALEIR